MRTIHRSLGLCAALLLALGGCAYEAPAYSGTPGATPGPTPGGYDGAAGPPSAPGGGYGATPGGAQDINYARDLVRSGSVPGPEAFTVEGLLSQHDLPSDGAPCEDLLCARPSIAHATSLADGESHYWMLLGMSSGIVEFERPPIDLSLVIDASGSMAGDMEETLVAARRLVEQLRPEDQLSIVVFRDDVDVTRAMSPLGEDRSAALAALTGVPPQGGSALFNGMAEGYEQVRSADNDPSRLRRVVVLSCANASVIPETMLEGMIDAGSAERIGLTFVGVLLGWDPQLADILGRHRGGNQFYTGTLEEIEQVFDADLDFNLTPLAYDLEFELALADGWEIERLYGLPGDDAADGTAGFGVGTAFISRGGGGIMVELRRGTADVQADLGTVSLSYEPESAHGWDGVFESDDTVEAPAESGVYYGGPGVQKGVALVNMAAQLAAASEAFHGGDAATARDLTDALLTFLTAEAEALDDDRLRDEVEFVEAYRALLD